MIKSSILCSSVSICRTCGCFLVVAISLAQERSRADQAIFDSPPASSQPASQPAAPTPETLKHYNSLYGSDEHHAAQAGGREQAKFAQKLLDATRELKDDPDLVSYMLDKSYAFGLKDPSGYETASDAIKKLDELRTWPAEMTAARRRSVSPHVSACQRRPADENGTGIDRITDGRRGGPDHGGQVQ